MIDKAMMFERARRAMHTGNTIAAVECFKDILTEDPEDGLAHALLSMALLNQRRLHAARFEADRAVALAPEFDFAHAVRGLVALAEHDLPRAEGAFEQALALDPDDADNYRYMATYHRARQNWPEALRFVGEALDREAQSVESLVLKGELLLRAGIVAEARLVAEEALAIAPENPEVLAFAGTVRLREGDPEGARDFALWALQINATDEDALELLADVKTRQSWLMGLYWRYHVWLSGMGFDRALLVLLGAFVVTQVVRIALVDLGQGEAAGLVSIAWLAFCLYTWAGGAVRDRMVAKELEKVRLRPDF